MSDLDITERGREPRSPDGDEDWCRCLGCGGPLPLKPEGDYCDACWFGTEGQAQYAFRQVYPADHVNFMTPKPIGFGWVDRDTVYEISEGRGFDHEPIFGVSIVVRVDGEWVKDESGRSKLMFTKQDALDYVRKGARK